MRDVSAFCAADSRAPPYMAYMAWLVPLGRSHTNAELVSAAV